MPYLRRCEVGLRCIATALSWRWLPQRTCIPVWDKVLDTHVSSTTTQVYLSVCAYIYTRIYIYNYTAYLNPPPKLLAKSNPSTSKLHSPLSKVPEPHSYLHLNLSTHPLYPSCQAPRSISTIPRRQIPETLSARCGLQRHVWGRRGR